MEEEEEDNALRKKYGKLSDNERHELVKKLDDDIEGFIEELAKRKENKPKKPFDFDEWCKELDQHPAFMTDLKANENGEYSEAIQALQALKYDDSEVEDRQLEAERNKEEGNKHFGFKKYRWAVDSYGNGIKQYCKNRKLNSVLYANRAAAHKRLCNYRSAFRDCYFARRFDPSNLKSIIRGAECLIQLHRGEECMEWLESSEKAYRDSLDCKAELKDSVAHFEKIKELKGEVSKIIKQEQRDARRERRKLAEDLLAKRKLLSVLANRKLHFDPPIDFDDPFSFEWSQIESQLPWLDQNVRVYVNDEGVLSWPILVQYPELQKVNAVTDCSEKNTVENVFGAVFTDDENAEMWRNGVRIFISLDVDSDYDAILISPNSTVQDVLSTKGYVIRGGLPVVQAYTPEHAEKSFVKIRDSLYKTV